MTTNVDTQVIITGATIQHHTVRLERSADGFGLTGNVSGHPFSVKGANSQTAKDLRDRALRTAAMWQAAMDAGFTL